MDSSSFANTSLVKPRCRLLTYIRSRTTVPLCGTGSWWAIPALTPNRSYGLKASVSRGFDQRRFDLLAVVRLVLQSWMKVLLVITVSMCGKFRLAIGFPRNHRPGYACGFVR